MLTLLYTPELIAVLCFALARVIAGGRFWFQYRFSLSSGVKHGRKVSTPDGERLESNTALYGARLIAAGLERDVELVRTMKAYAKWSEESFWR
ncbi:MAG: hypothetical protein C4575_14010 [Desulforudis sp.]|jgi:hypothetical protein|nr:MAG: hypothetical protein C4575_14010 [Desulforudis sp.]